VPGPTSPSLSIARDGALSHCDSGGPLNPGHSLKRDDCPVYPIQLPAKINNQEVDVNFAEHLSLLEGPVATGSRNSRPSRSDYRSLSRDKAARQRILILMARLNYIESVSLFDFHVKERFTFFC
jgi:hypothetical protein